MKILKNLWATAKNDFREMSRKQRVFFCIAIPLLGLSTGFLLEGCSMFGANPSAPTKAESLLYNTITNYHPVVLTVTNYATNQVIQTVTTQVTNTVGVTLTVTNYATNTITVATGTSQQTNQVPGYTETLKPGVASAVQSGGGILNVLFPGIGSIATNAVIALLGGWGYLRSQKNGANLTSTLTAEVQVARQLLQGVPNGATLDNEFVNWIQNHQADAGVLQQVMTVIANEVNTPAGANGAATAANQIAQTVAALVAGTTPATPVPPAAPKV